MKLPLLVLAAGLALAARRPRRPRADARRSASPTRSPTCSPTRGSRRSSIKHARLIVGLGRPHAQGLLERRSTCGLARRRRGQRRRAARRLQHRDIEPKYFGKGPTASSTARCSSGSASAILVTDVHPVERGQPLLPADGHASQARRRLLQRRCAGPARGCKVLAAEVLDMPNLTSWMRKFKRYHDGRATWGLHNYLDAKTARSARAGRARSPARQGRRLVTEAGGLVGLQDDQGPRRLQVQPGAPAPGAALPVQADAHPQVRKRLQARLHLPLLRTWTKTRKTNRWDSGPRDSTGKPRPAYDDLEAARVAPRQPLSAPGDRLRHAPAARAAAAAGGVPRRLRAADLILHAGDFRPRGPRRARGARPAGAAVLGNVDEPALRRAAAGAARRRGGRRADRHGPRRRAGKGRLERLRRAFPDADAVVFGHSHIPLHERAPDGFQIFNPGSPTDRRRQPRAHDGHGDRGVRRGALRAPCPRAVGR